MRGTQEQESNTPGIAVTFYAVGVLSLLVGVLSIYAASQNSGSAAQSDMIGAVCGIIGGFLFIAIGYALKKLCQIEAHLLRLRNDADAKK